MSHMIREGLAAFRRAPLLTALSAAMMALALLVVGLFGMAAHNLQLALDTVEERVELVAYLRDDARDAEVEIAVSELRALGSVADVRHVSRERALERAREELPEFREVFADLEANPLPASLEVRLHQGYRDPDVLEDLAALASSFPFVEDVRYGQEWVEQLFVIRRIGALTAGALGGAFALVAALIIGAAVRMAVFARREEIYVMRLVGATNGFIRRPFLLEGALTGLAGAVLATLLTWGAHLGVRRWIFPVDWLPAVWVVGGVLAGVALGVAASGLAVRRYLREV